jgi:DNA replication protein DnaC
MPSMMAYLTRVLKTPTIGRVWEELATQARDENWSHEDYLAAVLQRQLADRESKGTTMRIRTAHFPAVKTLEDSTSTTYPRCAATCSRTWPPPRSSPRPTT